MTDRRTQPDTTTDRPILATCYEKSRAEEEEFEKKTNSRLLA